MISILRQLRKKDWGIVAILFLFILVEVWAELRMPDYTVKLTQSIATNEITQADTLSNGGMMLLFALISLVCTIFSMLICTRLASTVSFRLREKVYNKVSGFSGTEMRKFSIASLITRSTNDVTQVQMFFAMGLHILLKAPTMAVWGICKISLTSVEWTLATLICVVCIMAFVSILLAVCLPKFKKMQTLIDNVNNATRENVSGIRVVHAFNAENFHAKKFEKVNSELTNTQLFTIKSMGLLMPVITFFMNALTLAIYWIGAVLTNNAPTLERAVVIGNMTAFSQYALMIVMSFMLLVVVFVMLPRALVSSKRINEVLNQPLSIVDGSITDTKAQGSIEFKNVNYNVAESNLAILSNINFSIKPGETVAIIGATGSGKTTLIELIPRLTDVSSGEIDVDGVNVKDYTLASLNEKIALVSQKAVLFKGKISDNIAYGAENNIDEKKMKKAIEIAQAQFIYDLPGGVEHEVAQGGTNFSGGQKQRLSIARAIYKDAPIIIFDDSFSALDYKTDLLVRQNIKKYLPNKTILIVAQRIGTIKHADKIIVMDSGEIVGIGTHNELLKTCKIYKEIALSQLSKEEL